MPYDRCWFAARTPSDAAADVVASRARALARFYGRGDAEAHLTLHRLRPLGVTVGSIALGAAPRATDTVFGWGAPYRGEPVLAARDEALRAYRGPGSVLAFDDHAARIVTAAVDLTAAYAAGDGVWSSHAVAAGFLAEGEAQIRSEALAELAAFGHPAGDATLVRGVRAIPAATVIELGGERAAERCVLAPEERWHLVGERHAYEVAAHELGVLLDDVAGPGAWLGLSAGMDSRVLAVALAGRGTPAFTWGADGAPDVAGAREVAGALGLRHRLVELELLPEDAVDEASRHLARWSDGAEGVVATAEAPADLAHATVLTGVGGELGRAYHYALLARNHRRPRLEHLVRAWQPEAALPAWAGGLARAHVRERAREELERAAAVPGIDGWRVLDVVYAQARMRRWTRGRTGPAAGDNVPAFLTPPLAAALVAQRLEDRLTGAFHRGYVAERAPALAPAAPPGQRAGVPAPVRRAVAALRRRRPAPVATPSGPGDPRLADLVRHPLVAEAFEERAADVAQLVAAGDRDALAFARTVAGAVLLAEELAALR